MFEISHNISRIIDIPVVLRAFTRENKFIFPPQFPSIYSVQFNRRGYIPLHTYQKTGQASRIIDIMAEKGLLTFADETALVDRLNENLERAAFLLMIIGDGIRTGVQQLGDFLNGNTSMAFHLALAEIEVYERGDDTIVIPYLLTKTAIIDRNAIRLPSATEVPRKWKYVSGPILSRTEFIERFSENGGFDEDQVIELIYSMESISGLSVRIMPTELTLQLSTPDNRSFALLTFSISQGHADLYIMPSRIKSALVRAGLFTFEAQPFLDAYKPFVALNRCKTPPYEYEEGFYYADVNKVLSDEMTFISAVEQFVIAVDNATKEEQQ